MLKNDKNHEKIVNRMKNQEVFDHSTFLPIQKGTKKLFAVEDVLFNGT